MITGTLVFNILRIGKHVQLLGDDSEQKYINRPFVEIPESPIKKWGNEYILFRGVEQDDIELMVNGDGSEYWSCLGIFGMDRRGMKYMRIHRIIPSRINCDYWITTFEEGINVPDKNHSVIKDDPNSLSCIFSLAFDNKHRLYEAIAILQVNDVLNIGNRKLTFNPIETPFIF